jgi:UDP-galactopyranose mutase
LLSRFARDRDVLFVEEPIAEPAGETRIEARRAAQRLEVLRPFVRCDAGAFGDAPMRLIQPLLLERLARTGTPAVVWLYTPMALPLARAVGAPVTVYDCMDELSAFLHAPAELRQRESELIAESDLVFTGGPSLYRAKRDLHPRVYCFPSSVDAAHFGGALNSHEPDDQLRLPHPRLGFFGVIDERIDLALLDELARRRPDWQLVMIGPVVKIDPASLPRRPNLHYLGARLYEELPAYLAGWDVCLLPFALNEATRFISPTKTLEYMAAEKPIVATPIRDVAEPYADVVEVADGADEFIAACERLLRETGAAREQRALAMRAVVARTSWDATARAMLELIDEIRINAAESSAHAAAKA